MTGLSNGPTHNGDDERKPVLLVDDNDVIASALEFALTEEGYPVTVAANGKEALDSLEYINPCLILLDMKMPVMDGWAFAAAYRQRSGPHAPIVVMTAAHELASRAAEIAADGHIAKPFDLGDLLALVHRYAR